MTHDLTSRNSWHCMWFNLAHWPWREGVPHKGMGCLGPVERVWITCG